MGGDIVLFKTATAFLMQDLANNNKVFISQDYSVFTLI